MSSDDEFLFIVDFDDTIFPTTWAVNFYFDKSFKALPDNMHDYVEHLTVFLSTIKTFGRVLILTNSICNWVENGVKELFGEDSRYPDAVKAVLGVDDIIYARENHPTVPPEEAKKHAFKQILSQYTSAKHVIAFGDHEFDQTSFKEAIKSDKQDRRALFVKFRMQPSFNMLSAQLELLNTKIIELMTKQPFATGTAKFLAE